MPVNDEALAAGMGEDTARAARLFLQRTGTRYELARAVLYGSRARGDAGGASDLDIAVVLRGPPAARADAAIDMAGIAFDVMLETGVLVDPMPLWPHAALGRRVDTP